MKKILLFIGLTLTCGVDAKQPAQSDEAIKQKIRWCFKKYAEKKQVGF